MMDSMRMYVNLGTWEERGEADYNHVLEDGTTYSQYPGEEYWNGDAAEHGFDDEEAYHIYQGIQDPKQTDLEVVEPIEDQEKQTTTTGRTTRCPADCMVQEAATSTCLRKKRARWMW